ncbi:MAG: fasciclin domain-containing protein [Nocardioides sp.]
MKKYIGAAALALAVGGTALAPAPALAGTASEARAGTTSLAEVLAADGQKFDGRWSDFDITEAAAYAVIGAKPDSPVALLADGTTRLTAFLPTDRAFQALVKDLTGKKLGTEQKVFKAVAGLGIDTVEAVLLYHVVPGKTLTSGKVVAADGQKITTALAGATFTVKVKGSTVRLKDGDRNDANPQVVALDINKGNRQVAHAINRVLRPMDL